MVAGRSTTRPLASSRTRPTGWRAANWTPGCRCAPDELGRLAASFNRMTRELQPYVQALTASRDQLRGHLAMLGDTLSSTHDLHRILQVILRTALSATGARAGVVLLIDPATAARRAAARKGWTGRWDLPGGPVDAADAARARVCSARWPRPESRPARALRPAR